MKTLFLMASLIATLSAHAGDKGNGGNTVDINGVPRLKDLVDTTVCRWVDGQTAWDANPHAKVALDQLAKLDWYFALELKEEILRLNYCMTTKLRGLDTSDLDGFVIAYQRGTNQVGIRFNDQVFLDESIMARMPEVDRGYLLIHEALHFYVHRREFMRNNRVKSMVASLAAVERGEIKTRRELHLQMTNNKINFPQTVEKLSLNKDLVLYLVGDKDQRQEVLARTDSLATLFGQFKDFNVSLLALWHQQALGSPEMERLIRNGIAEGQDDALVRTASRFLEGIDSMTPQVTSNGRIQVQGAEVLASQFNPEQLFTEITALGQFPTGRTECFEIIVSYIAQDDFGNSEVVSTPTLECHQVDFNFTRAAAPALKTYLLVVSELLRSGELELLDKITVKNPLFYQALTGATTKGKLLALNNRYPMERTVAVRKLNTLLRGFWVTLQAHVTKELGASAWESFLSRVDASKFDYDIQ